MTTTRGKFVVFEGLDGAGTSTQITRLRDWLVERGERVETSREPSDGPIGLLIRQALGHRLDIDPATLALLFAADRTDHLFNATDGVVRTLESGAWVLTDRYVLSSLAYQATTGLPPEWVAQINARAIEPDLTIFIDTPVDVCVARIDGRSSRDELFHKRDFLARTAAEYDRILTHSRLTGHLLRLPGDAPPDTVAAEITRGIEAWLAGK
ncbi:MAG: dTMP kinase [Candidatus Sumerlaeota bacterium]|nr:dTMP kinase [Candidatus Sumerlaeota bacterium]